MKFVLIDRITELVPGERISAVKALSLAEEYLSDHFPRFPVLPGVLMIEAVVQASAWLVRVTEDFAHSMILLSEAKNVTYKSFVSPGQVFELTVEAKAIGSDSSRFVGVGRCGQTEMVKAHWSLRHFNLADEDPVLKAVDERLVASARQQMELLLPSV
ncbi:MAG: beta-hydroxyacyl-ACP dehydratase [Planctomycetota bacterium]|nr:MAG: beta-hydroxyacyl-ACP dehydratase [Planctomycetota bacterium]